MDRGAAYGRPLQVKAYLGRHDGFMYPQARMPATQEATPAEIAALPQRSEPYHAWWQGDEAVARGAGGDLRFRYDIEGGPDRPWVDASTGRRYSGEELPGKPERVSREIPWAPAPEAQSTNILAALRRVLKIERPPRGSSHADRLRRDHPSATERRPERRPARG